MPKKDIGLGVVSVGFGAWILYYTAENIKKKSAFWPNIIGWGIIALGVVILAIGVFNFIKEKKANGGQAEKKAVDKKAELNKYLKVAAVVGLLVVFYFVFQYVSYILAMVILMIGTSFILGYRNWKIMIPTALILSVLLYVTFTQVFHVHFPGPFY